jgi:hypothetical protein
MCVGIGVSAPVYSLSRCDRVTIKGIWFISIVLENGFLNNVISFKFLTWIGGRRVVARLTCDWFQIVLWIVPNGLLSHDEGKTLSLESSSIDRIANQYGNVNNFGIL